MTGLYKVTFVTIALLLAGCAAKAPTQIYKWDNYQDTVYKYYSQDANPQEQIAALQQLIEKAKASSKPVPPGVHAHLGMLYSNTGKMDLAMTEFNSEKRAFPESATYIDFLTSKNKSALK
ncbi:DUF4810 domain-containing protein [Cedecea davisae]|uniref:DUF4810 domain-containing protein n=1 Tax=Cedecea davisae TaxID=158484 RepID=UPI001D0BD533|nr:DUF4810 domain-containing protein [Cedecea davisae]